MLGAMLAFCLSLSTSVYFFTGFLGGGRSWVGVFQAFLLCFGVGSFLYLPASLLFFMARHVRAYGPKMRIGIASVIISLPLWATGGANLILKLPYTPYALISMLLGLLVLWWGVLIMTKAKATETVSFTTP